MTRKIGIDYLRILSALAVIVIHTVSAPLTNHTAAIDVNIAVHLELIHTLMNWSVPVFFMITGYCMLMKQECTYKYCFSHVLKYVGVLFSVGFFYALLENIYSSSTISITVITASISNVISGNLWDHMWYVYSIIGIYLVLPVIHSFIKSSYKDACILTGLLFLFSILCPFLEEWLPIGISLPFTGYLFYVCFGGIAAKYKINHHTIAFLHLAGVLSIVWIITSADLSAFGYKSPAICFIALSIFLLFSRMERKPNPYILRISECTWGIYLLHPLFINILIKLLKVDLLSSSPYLKICAFAIFLFVISFITTYFLRKIPYLKRLF